jgi:uncharacterized protein (DUF305 family)
MTSPMPLIEIVIMRTMYHNKKWNIAIMTSASSLELCSSRVSDSRWPCPTQCLRSMVPHHAGAILMCDQMKGILRGLDR